MSAWIVQQAVWWAPYMARNKSEWNRANTVLRAREWEGGGGGGERREGKERSKLQIGSIKSYFVRWI